MQPRQDTKCDALAMGFDAYSKWLAPFIVCITLSSVSFFLSVRLYRKKSKVLDSTIKELQASLSSSMQKCGAERQGRIRAQQSLRKLLAQPKSENSEQTSYPMTPIGIVQSCFSTRNGTPRQPLLVPLARACMVFDSARVPPASLEGLAEYSHCWIIYIFHLNTDLEKLWKKSSTSKFKAKVRVPRLKGGKMGVFATRTPHRPCPIGLTVAKVEAVQGNMVLLSGVDLVDGTPILDIKPYLPYCDSIQGAVVPDWVKVDNTLAVASVSFSDSFSSSLTDCWEKVKRKSLYASGAELQCLIKQVLSWDIRSVSQRIQPHAPLLITTGNNEAISDLETLHDEEAADHENGSEPIPCGHTVYHLVLEETVVSYRIDSDGNVIVEKVIVSDFPRNNNHANYLTWMDILG